MKFYNPSRFAVQDIGETFDLMDRNPFATLISVDKDEPLVSHLPLTPKRVNNRIELIGHLSRANPHAKVLFSNKVVKAIFHGPHAYISPKWYVENDVPTWNYSVVHVAGTVELIEDYEGILLCLRDLSSHAERHWPSGWQFFVPDDLKDPLLPKHIVGFKITIDEIQHKNKMGQNRSVEDLVGVVRGLESRGDDNARGVRDAINKLFPELKK